MTRRPMCHGLPSVPFCPLLSGKEGANKLTRLITSTPFQVHIFIIKRKLIICVGNILDYFVDMH